MKARRLLPTAILALLVAPGAAGADGLAGRFSIAVQAGTQSEIGGELLADAQGTLLGKPASIHSVSYRDVQRPALRLAGVLGYGLGSRVELFVRGGYYEVDEAGIEAGTFEGKPLFAFFERYREIGAEVGLRYYIASQSRLKSYIGPVIGVRDIDEVLVSLSVPDAGTAVLNVPFTEAGTVAVFGGDLGLSFDLTPHLQLGVDTGLRYQKSTPAFEALPELGGPAPAGGRWTAPVSLTLGLRF